MKITDVQAHILALPRQQDELTSPWIWGDFSQVVVVVDTDEGITGYGEAFSYGVPQATASVVNQVLKPLLIGADPTHITALLDQMYRQTHLFGRYGITTFAISGVDIALWDIAGKCAGLPLYRLFGSGQVDSVPAYASLVRYSEIDHVRQATARAKVEGYAAIKLHQIDADSLDVAREVVGDDVHLMMDINCAWTPEEALSMAQLFSPYEPLWLEEPLWPPEDFSGLARLGDLSGLAIATGENACTVYQFRQMLDAGAATYIQPSVIKVGGISEWRKVAAVAEPYNVSIMPHSPYFGPGLLATAHLVAATPRAPMLEYLYVKLAASLFSTPLAVQEGSLSVPQGPGLGLDVDLDVLQRYRVQPSA